MVGGSTDLHTEWTRSSVSCARSRRHTWLRRVQVTDSYRCERGVEHLVHTTHCTSSTHSTRTSRRSLRQHHRASRYNAIAHSKLRLHPRCTAHNEYFRSLSLSKIWWDSRLLWLSNSIAALKLLPGRISLLISDL